MVNLELTRPACIIDTKYGQNWYSRIKKIRDDYKKATGREISWDDVINRDIDLAKEISAKKIPAAELIMYILNIIYFTDMCVALNRKDK